MANTTFNFAKSLALTDYMPAFRQSEAKQSWAWDKITSKKSTTRATEQVFSFGGLPVARKTDELEPIYYADMSEQAATTFTVGKYTLSTMFSHEFLKDQWHLPEMLKEAGSAAGDSHSFIRDLAVATVLNRAFNSTYTMYDGVELCGSHTLQSGDTYDNDLTPASITYDNVWAMVNHFETSLYTQSGLYINDKPDCLVYHPSKEKEVQAILKSTLEPGTADNDKNTILQYGLKPVKCRHLATTTNWFITGSRFANDFLFFNREGVQNAQEDDFDRMGVKFRSYQRFAVGVRDFLYIVGNPGA